MSHSYMRLADVSPEDVEDGVVDAKLRDSGVIDDKDIIDYVRKYSSTTQGHTEFYLSLLQDIFYHPNLKTNRLFIENPVTGQFQVSEGVKDLRDAQKRQDQAKVDEDDKLLEGANGLVELSPEEELDFRTKMMALPPRPRPREKPIEEAAQENLAEEWHTVTMEYRNFAFVKRMIFLIFQGLLAGFCVVTVFLEEALDGSKSDFFTYYQPFAQEVRRYMYLLATLSLLGMVDHVLTTWNHISSPNPLADGLSTNLAVKINDYQRTSMLLGIILTALYVICFLSTVIMSPFDVLVYIKNDDGSSSTSTSNWADVAVDDEKFSSSYRRWSTLNSIRAATAMLAWLCTCYLLWRDISRYTKMWHYLRNVRKTAILWMKRARLLQGQEDLDTVSYGELAELISSQEFGLQRSRMALSLMLLERQQRQQLSK